MAVETPGSAPPPVLPPQMRSRPAGMTDVSFSGVTGLMKTHVRRPGFVNLVARVLLLRKCWRSRLRLLQLLCRLLAFRRRLASYLRRREQSVLIVAGPDSLDLHSIVDDTLRRRIGARPSPVEERVSPRPARLEPCATYCGRGRRRRRRRHAANPHLLILLIVLKCR